MKDKNEKTDLSNIYDKIIDIKNSVEKIDKKVDAVDKKVVKQEITLARNTDSLEFHIKRTNLAEQKIDEIEKDILTIKVSYKTVVVVASVIGAIVGIIIPLVGKGILWKNIKPLF